MNIFKKMLLKKKDKVNLSAANAVQMNLINYNPQSDETVKLSNPDFAHDALTESLSVQKVTDNDTIPLSDFDFDNFGETVLLSTDNCIVSDETVLLNNNSKNSNESNNFLKPFSLNNIFFINPLFGDKININKPIFTIGSGDNVDYRICKPDISSNHASIFIKSKNEFYIVDNGSTNGSQVEGISIEPMKITPIENGDLITFGEELYQFYIEE